MISNHLVCICLLSALVNAADATDVQGVTDEGGSKAIPASAGSFFVGLTDQIDSTLSAAASLPDSIEEVAIDDYPQILREFNWWARELLAPSVLPDSSFVAANLRLFHANGREREEDLVFLPYQMDGNVLMIVQSGGIRARMWIFVRDPKLLGLADDQQRASTLRKFLNEYVNPIQLGRVPPFSVSRRGAVLAMVPAETPSESGFSHISGYLRGDEVSFIISKESRRGTMSAQEPMPNQWFEWWKKK